MAQVIARTRIEALLPTLHEDVVVEEVDCDVYEVKSGSAYYGTRNREFRPGRLMYVSDNSKEHPVSGIDRVLHILLTERGTFAGAVLSENKIDPAEIKTNYLWRVSAPFGSPSFFPRMTVDEVIDHLGQLTPQARQERKERYEKQAAAYAVMAAQREEERRVEREQMLAKHKASFAEMGLTEDQTAKMLDYLGW